MDSTAERKIDSTEDYAFHQGHSLILRFIDAKKDENGMATSSGRRWFFANHQGTGMPVICFQDVEKKTFHILDEERDYSMNFMFDEVLYAFAEEEYRKVLAERNESVELVPNDENLNIPVLVYRLRDGLYNIVHERHASYEEAKRLLWKDCS